MDSKKTAIGILSSIIGFIGFIFFIDLISKPDNVPVSFNPIEGLSGFFFSFVFLLGNIGWIVGALLFLSYLYACYFVGTWLYELLTRKTPV